MPSGAQRSRGILRAVALRAITTHPQSPLLTMYTPSNLFAVQALPLLDPIQVYPAFFDRIDDHACGVADTHFFHDVFAVAFDGAGRYEQLFADLRIGLS
jgi:hypothetical protein